MRDKKCAECRWWDGADKGYKWPCRVKAPVVMSATTGGADGDVVYSFFPQTQSIDWCGQFAARETAKEETEVVGTGAFPGEAIAGNVAAKSPLAERGFRLIDKELWEKEVAPKPLTKPPTSTVEDEVNADVKRSMELRDLEVGDEKESARAYFTGRIDGLHSFIDIVRSAPPLPKRTRWMVDTRKNKTQPLSCENCHVVAFSHCGIVNKRVTTRDGSRIGGEHCPAREVECDI